MLAFFYCAAFFLMPLYLTTVRGDESFAVGFMLLPTTAVVAIISPVVGRLVDKIGAMPLLFAGLTLLAMSAGLQSFFSSETSLPFVITAFAIMGLGWAAFSGRRPSPPFPRYRNGWAESPWAHPGRSTTLAGPSV